MIWFGSKKYKCETAARVPFCARKGTFTAAMIYFTAAITAPGSFDG
jgi:hypothetical protein